MNNGGIYGNMIGSNYCVNCCKAGHIKKNGLKLKKKGSQISNHHASNGNGTRDRQIYDSQDMAFTATSENQNLFHGIWFCDSEACGHYCNFKEGLFDVKEICEDITVGNGKTMITTKSGSLKCNVFQLDVSNLVVTFHEVKYVPELWVNPFCLERALSNRFQNEG
jgi:hypothetical protein